MKNLHTLSLGNPQKRKTPRWKTIVAALVVLGIVIGGFFEPLIGLTVPLFMLVALSSNLIKSRWFCSTACPRAHILSGLIAPFSGYRPLPKSWYSPQVRMTGCVFLMVCSIGQTLRLWPELANLGQFFWLICVVTLLAAIIMGIYFKPRSWCAVCPLGTLQEKTSTKPELP